MRIVSKFSYTLIMTALLALAASGLSAQSVLVRAEAKPSVVMVGESSSYSIRFLNTTSIPNLNTPRVEGLDFSNTPGTSSYQQIINGRVSVETEVSWQFRPTRLGTFTIPGRVISIGGEDIQIPDVEVQAVPMDEETRSRALIVLQMPDPPYYVGQALPARFNMMVRRDLNLTNVARPVSSSENFQHTDFDNNPQRANLQYKGNSYTGLIWDILITPIKAGPGELRFSQEVAVSVVTPDERFPSIFTMSRTRTEALTIFSEPLETEILPLPTEGRPDSFRDAIGDFTVKADYSTLELMVGEPITLTITIKGEGNFDRISPPEIPEWDNWRVYPPKISFEAEDATGFTGRKSFEYILIPQSEEITEIPAIAYATFNPADGEYRTMQLEARPVEVKPSDKPVDSTPITFSVGAGNDEETEQVPEKILPLKPGPGQLVPVGSVFWKEPLFWLCNALGLVVLGALALWNRRRRRLETDSRLARRHAGSRKVRQALQAAQEASGQGQAEDFLRNARFAIQESLCHLSRKPLEANTLVTSDCLAIMKDNNLADDLVIRIEKLLYAADAAQFAGARFDTPQLEDLNKDLASAITELNRISK